MANRPMSEDFPAPPTAMISALHEDVSIIKDDIRQIKSALMGTTMQPNGVIPRLAKVEEETAAHGKKLLVWGSILSAAGVVFVFVKDLWLDTRSR